MDLLHKTIPLGTPLLIFLQLNKLQLSKRIEEAPNVIFGKREVDIANV